MDISNTYPNAPVTQQADITDFSGKSIQTDPYVIRDRAAKYNFGMGEASPGEDLIASAVSSGTEQDLRATAVTADYEERRKNTEGMVDAQLSGGVTGLQSGDAEFIRTLGIVEPKNPETVLEEKYGENVISILKALDESDSPELYADEDAVGYGFEKATSDFVAKKQIAQQFAEDYSSKDMGWGAYAAWTGVQMLPLFQWGNIIGDYSNTDLEGSVIRSKIDKLYQLPPDQFKAGSKAEIERLAQLNPLDAEKFANALVQYGDNDRDTDTFFGLVDLATFIPGSAYARLAKAGKTTTALTKMKTVVKAVSQRNVSITDVLANTGNYQAAAEAIARESMAKKLLPATADKATIMETADALKQTPSLWNAKYFAVPGGNYPAVAANRLAGDMENIHRLISQASGGTLRATTLTPEAYEAAFDAAEAQYKKRYNTLSDNILSIERVAPDRSPTGTGRLIINWGRVGGKEAFETESGALQAARLRYKLSKDSFPTQLPNGKWVIQQHMDVAENFEDMFSKLLTTENKSAPANMWAYTRRFLMGGKESVSKFQAEQRAATVHGVSRTGELIARIFQPRLEKLSNQQLKDLDSIMTINRDSFRVPGDGSTRGMFYQTPGELSEAYTQIHNRLPTEEEVSAYFTNVTMSDYDWWLRSISQAKQKIRKGHQDHTFSVLGAKGEKVDVSVEAAKVDSLPLNSPNDAVFLLIDKKDGKPRAFRLSDLAQEAGNLKQQGYSGVPQDLLKDQGYVAFKVYDPMKRDLNDVIDFNEPIHYIVVNGSVKTAPINLGKQVPYRPGFHVEYNMPNYIKQAQFSWNRGRRAHIGDVTLLGAKNETEGKELIGKLEQARVLFKAKKEDELSAFLEKNLPWDLKEFKQIMTRFSPDTPFSLTRDGRNTADSSSVLPNGKTLLEEYGEMDDLVQTSHNDAAMDFNEFMGEKDPMLKQVSNAGTERDPVWQLKDADMFSPMNTQMRAMGRIMRSQAYEDYQVGAVNSFMAEFGKTMTFNGKPLSPDQLRRNPMYFFRYGDINHADKQLETTARDIRDRIITLVGTPSPFAAAIDDMKLRLMQSGKDYVPDKMLPFIKDPARYARAVASHTKLGMFNPTQLFLQSATLFNIAAISPAHGLEQIPATMLMRLLSFTEDEAIIDNFAQKLSAIYKGSRVSLRWTPDMFKESYKGYQNSGFGVVGGEYSWRSDISDPKLFRGKVKKYILDKGYVFFNHAERNVRMASWNTAYSEHVARPGVTVGNLKDADFRRILVRAQDLSGNMTRDANAFWQKGVLGSTTQFYAYTARVTELLMGKRLSVAEKARLAGGIGLLYGLPAFAGLGYAIDTGDWGGFAASVNPFDEDLRTYALENGYKLDETTWGSINNGILSSLGYLMTGKHFDVSARFSPYSTTISDTVGRNFDESNVPIAVLTTLMGASGSIIRDMVTSAYPVGEDLYQMVGNGEGSQLLVDDFINAFREISSMNATAKAYAALNGSMYLSKKGTLIASNQNLQDEAYAKVLEAVTGLQGYDETDVFRMIDSMDEDKADYASVMKEVKKYGNYYVQALNDNDDDKRKQYMHRIEALINGSTMDATKKLRLWADAFSGKELREGITDRFIKSGSPDQRGARQQLVR